MVVPELMYAPLDIAQHSNSLPKAIAAAGGHWWGPYIADVGPADIQAALQYEVRVNLWGVESNHQAIEQALGLGADAITLSDSSMLHQRLAE